MNLISLIKSNFLTISLIINLLLVIFMFIGNEKQVVPIEEKKDMKDQDFFSNYFKVDDRILFVGDSWIYLCNWEQLLDNKNIVNKGVGGLTSYQIFMRYNTLIEGKPNKIFLLMGANDLQKQAPENFIMENYHRILYQIKATSPLTDVYVISLFPINPAMRSEDNALTFTNESINKLNLTIKNFTDTFGIEYIDVNSLLKDETGMVDSTYTSDGVHLSDLGYEKIIPLIKSKLQEE